MMTTTTIRPCGEAALLLECADLAEAVALAGALERLRPDAVDVVAAARTVLVTARDSAALPGLRRRIEELLATHGPAPAPGSAPGPAASPGSAPGPAPSPGPAPAPADPTSQDPLPGARIRYADSHSGSAIGVADSGRPGSGGARADSGGARAGGAPSVTIDVRYDGPDLADVAEMAGVSTEAFVRMHTSITWRAAFGGFAPGFFYLVDARELGARGPDAREPGGGGPGEREPGGGGPGDSSGASGETVRPDPGPGVLPSIPRLGSPRPRVPAGSVAVADRFCAVYPGASPGGWRLLGTTDAALWDLDRPRPALLAPGMSVRFREAR